jgi:hydroxymethylpyrimidine/phosphomethylpyrimidine kinase
MRKNIPVALTIAGSDSGGGAGIQADLKTFAALGVHGTSAITCLTAQNPRGVFGIQAATPAMVRAQIEAVFAEFAPAALKSGMLYSTAIIRSVAACLKELPKTALVLDPVMVATSGARLLKDSAIRALRDNLFPLASLLTPNLDEAGVLTGLTIHSPDAMRRAAHQLHDQTGCAILLKGGHLRGMREAIDLFYDGRSELLLQAPFARGISTHGTGCTYSAAITALLARGRSLERAVQEAKEFITQAIVQSQPAGAHTVLNSFWNHTVLAAPRIVVADGP